MSVQVNKNLQVVGHANWFALGDCNDVQETKMGYLAMQQALALATSLHSLLSEGPQKAKLQEYKPFNGMEVRLLICCTLESGALLVHIWSGALMGSTVVTSAQVHWQCDSAAQASKG